MKMLLVFVTSWLAGILAYLGALGLFYHQTISRGDFSAVALWSLAAFAVAFFVVYLPALFALRVVLRGVHPAWLFPLVATLLGVFPTAAILFYWGGTLRSLWSPEASLFYAMFSLVGIVVGLGYVRIHRRGAMI
jgi:hypothetical protein